MSNLVRFDPFAEIRALQKQFFGDDIFTPLKTAGIPTTDVYMNGESEMIVEAHLPNFDEKDVNIHIEDGALIVQAERHEKEEDKTKKYVVRESSSSFYRRIALPKRADQDGIKANLDEGVLRVSIPFQELPEPKKIAIEKTGTKK